MTHMSNTNNNNDDIDYTIKNRLIIVGGSLAIAIFLMTCLVGFAAIAATLLS